MKRVKIYIYIYIYIYSLQSLLLLPFVWALVITILPARLFKLEIFLLKYMKVAYKVLWLRLRKNWGRPLLTCSNFWNLKCKNNRTIFFYCNYYLSLRNAELYLPRFAVALLWKQLPITANRYRKNFILDISPVQKLHSLIPKKPHFLVAVSSFKNVHPPTVDE